ncbi:hypothetical protein EJB05_04270, partial [Eragrostis curvula]
MAAMDAADASNGGVQQQHAGGLGLYYPPAASSSPASPFCYALGSGQDCAVTQAAGANGGGYYPALASMPLRSDGSLCITEAFRRSEEEQHHGVVVSSVSPKLEDFLGGGPAMAQSLDNSASFYYGGGHHHGHGAAYLQQYAMIPGHDVYGHGHASLVEEQSAAALAASWLATRSVGYVDVNTNAVQASAAGHHPHALALSMSSGSASQASCVTMQMADPVAEYITMEGSKKRGTDRGAGGQKQTVHRKSIDTFGQRTSQYRGVTRHRWTGRYEAHLWDNSCRKEGQTRKGRQGGYDMEEKAARAYDLAALKYWGPSTNINFALEDYREELEEMKNMTRQEYVAHLRRKSSGFSRGASIYRGVTRFVHLHLGLESMQHILVRRKKDGDVPGGNAIVVVQDGGDAVANAAAALVQAGTAVEWKFQATAAALPAPQSQRTDELLSSEAFSVLHDIVSVEADNNNAHGGNASAQQHMSNASSLATSVTNSREQSPDRGGGGLAMLFAKSAAASAKLAYHHQQLPMGSWVSPPPVSARPAVSIAHLPMFAAWTDA